MVHNYVSNILKKSEEDVEFYRRWRIEETCRERAATEGETIQDISEAADTCVAGNRTNTHTLIRTSQASLHTAWW